VSGFFYEERKVETIQETPLAHQVNAACARLGVSRTTFYELLKDGKLRTFKIGGRVVVAEAELRRFVASQMGMAA
jgi:excisionase family DNA binding protein